MTLKPVLEEFARERDTYREFFLAIAEWEERPRWMEAKAAYKLGERIRAARKACEILEGIRNTVKADTGCCDEPCVACEAITHVEAAK